MVESRKALEEAMFGVGTWQREEQSGGLEVTCAEVRLAQADILDVRVLEEIT